MFFEKGPGRATSWSITGTMGLAAAGYHAIEHGIHAPRSIKALMEPVPRVREGRTLSASGAVSACMDITDGLAFSVHQISEASGVGFELDWEAIPVDPEVLDVAKATGEPLEDYVLYYGGDYQLLFTISPEGLDLIGPSLGDVITPIGKVTAREENVLIKDGQVRSLPNKGYEHFR